MAPMKEITRMWKGGFTDDVALWLAQQGWGRQRVHGASHGVVRARDGAGSHGVS